MGSGFYLENERDGDIALFNGTEWIVLHRGSNGQFLTLTTGRPAWAANPITAHEAASDPHTGYLREADTNWVDLTDGGATTLHSHAGSIPVVYRKSIDTSTDSDDSPNDDPHLVHALAANEIWAFELYVFGDLGASGGFRCDFTAPASATGTWKADIADISGTSISIYRSALGTDFAVDAADIATEAALWIGGVVVNSTNAGNFVFRHAQHTSNGTAEIVRANSYMVMTRLA
jgi:hypothetical protein